MMPPLHPRTRPVLQVSRDAIHASSRLERMLRSVGVDCVLAEQVLGDLAERYEEDVAHGRVSAARWRYARDIVRSAPHLGWSAIRDGGPRERARLAAVAAGLVVLVSLAVTAVGMRKGPPARLLAGSRTTTDGIVVNNRGPVQLPVRVVDARGRQLETEGISYRWVSGAPLAVSPNGVITCAANGDAVVGASLGSIATNVVVRCRPVRAVYAATWITLLAGGAAQDLPFTAVGLDGRRVTALRGELRVRDSTIATLSGATIRPLKAGETEVVVSVGDYSANIRVLVHEQVRAFTGLRSAQRLVAVPVRLARGDTIRFALPMGAYWVKYLPRRANDAPPTIFADVTCGPGDGMQVYWLPRYEYTTYCRIYTNGGGVTLAHGLEGAAVVEGMLAVERVEER